MKKILLTLCIALTAMTALAEEVVDTIMIHHKTQTTAICKFMLADDSMYYYAAATNAEKYDGIVAGTNPDFPTVEAFMQDILANRAEEEGVSIESLLYQGEKSILFTDFPTATDCVAFACKVNPATEECEAPFLCQRFTTMQEGQLDVVNAYMGNVSFEDNTATAGMWKVLGGTKDNIILNLECHSYMVPGHYTLSDIDLDATSLMDLYAGFVFFEPVSLEMDVAEKDGFYNISMTYQTTDFIYDIIYEPIPTAVTSVMNITSERDSIRPTKTLRNGQLIIWRNGHRYNTMGVDMKD